MVMNAHPEQSSGGRSCLTISFVALVAVILLVLAFPLFGTSRPTRHRSACLSEIKQLSVGVAIYQADWDDISPSSRWGSDITPYVRNTDLFTCPEVRKLGGKYGYAMNQVIVGKKVTTFANPATTIMLFETDHLAPNRVGPSTEAAFRSHDGRMSYSYSFLDTHAKIKTK